jgi:hypothetical protein
MQDWLRDYANGHVNPHANVRSALRTINDPLVDKEYHRVYMFDNARVRMHVPFVSEDVCNIATCPMSVD